MAKKSAFTLAEVLITLTIIGVIAAITIPNLMQNYKRNERITQIKEAYSIIKNAIKMAEAEHGNAYNWLQWSLATSGEQRESWPETYFIPYVKTQKICGWQAPYKSFGCFNSNTSDGNGYYYNLDGSTTDLKLYYKMVLQNGMHVGIAESSGGGDKRFIVDVNGNKGPNKAGNDVFFFAFSNTSTNVGQVFTGGLPPRYSSSAYHMECNPYGYDCSKDIERNGWKIPDDYPIKKF